MDKWKADDITHQTVTDLIANHHPHLAEVHDGIVVIFKEKASKKAGKPIMGKVAKAPAILDVLGNQTKFILEIGFDVYSQLSEDAKRALLDHLLCFIEGEEDEKSGEMKYGIAEPDIYYFSSEVDRHGYWRPTAITAQHNGQADQGDQGEQPSLIDDLLGESDNE